jgi:hypothetical protein
LEKLKRFFSSRKPHKNGSTHTTCFCSKKLCHFLEKPQKNLLIFYYCFAQKNKKHITFSLPHTSCFEKSQIVFALVMHHMYPIIASIFYTLPLTFAFGFHLHKIHQLLSELLHSISLIATILVKTFNFSPYKKNVSTFSITIWSNNNSKTPKTMNTNESTFTMNVRVKTHG